MSTARNTWLPFLGFIHIVTFIYVCIIFIFPADPIFSRLSLASGTALLILVLLQLQYTGRVILPPLIHLPWLFGIFALVSVSWAYTPNDAMVSALRIISALIGTSAVWIGLANGLSWRPIAVAIMLGPLVAMMTTLPQILTTGTQGRSAGILANPNFLAVELVAAAFLLLGVSPLKSRLSLPLAVGFLLFASAFTGSRKVLFSWIALGFLVFLQLLPRLRRSVQLTLAGGLMILLIFVMLINTRLPDSLQRISVIARAETLFSEQQDWSAIHRYEMTIEALEIWAQHPFVGIGVDQYKNAGSFDVYAHNNYAELLSGMGLLGLALYYALPLALLKKCFPRPSDRSIESPALFSLLLLLLLLDLGMVSFYNKVIWLTLALTAFRLSSPANCAAGVIPPRRNIPTGSHTT